MDHVCESKWNKKFVELVDFCTENPDRSPKMTTRAGKNDEKEVAVGRWLHAQRSVKRDPTRQTKFTAHRMARLDTALPGWDVRGGLGHATTRNENEAVHAMMEMRTTATATEEEEELVGITETGRERVRRETRCRPPRLATENFPGGGRLPEIRLATPCEAAKAEDTVMVWALVRGQGKRCVSTSSLD
jgi:hypothetical protein